MSTNNFLFEFNNTKETSKESELPVSSIFKRGLAGIIDVHITVILMAIYLEISFRLFYYQKYKKFFVDFMEKFGTETPKNTPEHLEYIFDHSIFYLTLFQFLFFLFYHIRPLLSQFQKKDLKQFHLL